MKLKYFSHSAFQITTDEGKVILIDPFLDGNLTSPVKSDDVTADYIILTHAHGDHLGDTFKIAKKHNSMVIAVNELADYCIANDVNAHNMHIGGGHNFVFGRVKFTIAHHGSLSPDNHFGGEPAGVLVTIDGITIYHAGDTGIFLDMKLIGEMNNIDYALLPIGDNFTMGVDDAVKATEFLQANISIPMHYNTFPVIEASPNEFKAKVESLGKKAIILEYGQEIDL
ncbi:MAG: metal-dependent hydrolase [Melioribacteraceae bacterium]|jgi:L-ascorbate metabolism protein UlaG (beta-lactamase superfamily)|nr:metal-dependent hydrolase [Melioribacteraceae bacterium]